MTAFKGTGTSSSPFTLSDDDGDSENEVMEAICPGSRCNTMSPRPTSRPLDPGLTDSVENVRIDERYRSHSAETGLKRKRSESVVSMDCQSDDSGDEDGPSTSTSAVAPGHSLPPAQGQSRKAKKRRIKAQAKKEQYLDRLRRLQHNPLLVPQLPPGYPAGAADSIETTSPFMFLPQFNSQLLNPLPIPSHQPVQDYSFGEKRAMHQNLWPMGVGMFPVQQPPSFDEQLPWSVHPQFTHCTSHPQPMASAMALDPSSASGQSEFYTLPPKFSPDIIGVKPDDDPAGKHGLFEIPKTALDRDNKSYTPKDPNPARTLVLEQLPKLNRSRGWITQWSLSVCQAQPVEILIDGKGKALVEFPSIEAAQKAWGSPRLGTANLGLKQHLLKGRPRDDLIRAHWYRVDEKSAGGGEEIEEGEIEEASVGKSGVGQQGKKDKNVKIRPPKRPRREEDPRHKARLAMVPQKPGVGQFTLTNGLPARPPQPPPPPPRYAPAPLPGLVPTNGDVPYRPTQVNHNDDMDISPPSTANGIPLGPRAMYPREEQRLNFPKLDVAPPKAASLPSPPNTTPSPAGPDSTALEADLRKRVRETKRMISMANTLPPLPPPPPPPLPQPLPTPPIVPHDIHSNWAPLATGMDVDSFLAGVPRPPPLSRGKVAPSAREEEKAREKAELFAKEAALAQELAALRENKRLRQTEQKRFSPAYTGPGSSAGLIKPSPKLGLDLAPDLVRRAPWLSQVEQSPVVIGIDDEDDDEGYEVEADGRDGLRV